MLDTLNIAYPIGYTFMDYPDNYSLSVIVYFMGCEQNCLGCQNPIFRNIKNDINTKIYSSTDLVKEIITMCIRNQTDKIVFSGGDPLHPSNIEGVKYLLKNLSNSYYITIYTSYNIEYIKDHNVLGATFIKSGVYMKDLHQISEKTNSYIKFASSNQKLYDKNLELISENGIYFFK